MKTCKSRLMKAEEFFGNNDANPPVSQPVVVRRELISRFKDFPHVGAEQRDTLGSSCCSLQLGGNVSWQRCGLQTSLHNHKTTSDANTSLFCCRCKRQHCGRQHCQLGAGSFSLVLTELFQIILIYDNRRCDEACFVRPEHGSRRTSVYVKRLIVKLKPTKRLKRQSLAGGSSSNTVYSCLWFIRPRTAQSSTLPVNPMIVRLPLEIPKKKKKSQ